MGNVAAVSTWPRCCFVAKHMSGPGLALPVGLCGDILVEYGDPVGQVTTDRLTGVDELGGGHQQRGPRPV